jgi:hypothetical protein
LTGDPCGSSFFHESQRFNNSSSCFECLRPPRPVFVFVFFFFFSCVWLLNNDKRVVVENFRDDDEELRELLVGVAVEWFKRSSKETKEQTDPQPLSCEDDKDKSLTLSANDTRRMTALKEVMLWTPRRSGLCARRGRRGKESCFKRE